MSMLDATCHFRSQSAMCRSQTTKTISDKLASLAVTTRYHRGQDICSHNHPSECWHYLVSGAAKTGVCRPDGRCQIVDIHLPGDFFGIDLVNDKSTSRDIITAEATLENTTISCYPRRRIEQLANSDSEVSREIVKLLSHVISRRQSQLLTLGRTTAREKVGSFLIEMAERLTNKGSDRVVLPISRYDIADYLAISVETVSRSISELRRRGLIALEDTRNVKILNRTALSD